MTLLVLAAGMGSRYGGLKQIDPFTENGEFIIDFSVFDAVKAGFDRVVFIIKKENYETFHETIGKRLEGKIKVEYAFQTIDYLVPADKLPSGRVKPWGTAHAVLCAENAIGDDGFLVINSDDFYGRDAFVKAAEFLGGVCGKGSKGKYAMIGYHLGNTLTDNGSVSRGVCETENGFLKKIVERTKIVKVSEGGQFCDEFGNKITCPPETIVSMNCWCFTSDVFEEAKEHFKMFLDEENRDPQRSECFLPKVIDDMKNEGKCTVEVIATTARWYGITYPEDKPGVKASLAELINSGVYPKGLWK